MKPQHLLLTALTLSVMTSRAHLHAQAAEHPTEVGLTQTPCAVPLYDAAALATALQVELASLGVQRVVPIEAEAAEKPGTATLALLHVRCIDDTQSVVISVVDLATGQHLTRELVLADVQPPERPRALSMATVVLFENAWSHASRHETDESLPDAIHTALLRRLRADLGGTPASASPAPPKATSQPSRTSLEAAALARTFPARGSALLGAELGATPVLARELRLALRAEALLGSQELSDQKGLIANMGLYWFTAGAGLEWVTHSQPQLSLGPFARVGYAIAHASVVRSGFTGKSESGLVSVIGVAATLRAALTSRIDALVGLDLGYMPSGVVFLADLSRSAGMAEVTLAARIGVSVGL